MDIQMELQWGYIDKQLAILASPCDKSAAHGFIY
jgi:hypothetical protein